MATWRYEISFLVLKKFSRVRCAHSWNIFSTLRRNLVSPRGHIIFSICYSFKILAPISRLIPHNPLALTIFGRRKQYTVNLYSWTFTQLNRDYHWLILGHMALTKIRCIPIYLSRIVPSSGFITARDKSMVESGVREGGKNATRFLFREWTVNSQQHKHEASS